MAKATHVYLIADTPNHERAVQEDHPPTQMSAFRIALDGRSEDEAIGEFIGAQRFPVGTVFGHVKSTSVAAVRLAPTLEPHDSQPGERAL